MGRPLIGEAGFLIASTKSWLIRAQASFCTSCWNSVSLIPSIVSLGQPR